MGDGDSVTRRRPVSLVGATVGAAVLASTSACVPTADPSTQVDLDRAEVLRSDPWLAPDDVQVGGPAPGSNGWYGPGRASSRRAVHGERAGVVAAEVTAAGLAGWTPFHGRCPEVDGIHDAAGEVVVHLVRRLPDGSAAAAEVTFRQYAEGPAGAVTSVVISATVANHLQPGEPPELPAVDVTDLACVSAPTGGRDQLAVGEPAPVNVAGPAA